MNRHPRDMTTNAAEGLPRRRFTVAELERMTAAGILDEDERIELIGGEIVPMSPKGDQHETLKVALNIYCARKLPAGSMHATETTFRLTPVTYLEPDSGGYRSVAEFPPDRRLVPQMDPQLAVTLFELEL